MSKPMHGLTPKKLWESTPLKAGRCGLVSWVSLVKSAQFHQKGNGCTDQKSYSLDNHTFADTVNMAHVPSIC